MHLKTLLLILFLLFQQQQPTPPPIRTVDPSQWGGSCSRDVLGSMQHAVKLDNGYMDYTKGCEVFDNCETPQIGTYPCVLRTIAALSQQCTADDLACHKAATLTALTIVAAADLDLNTDRQIIDDLYNALRDYSDGFYDRALVVYKQLDSSNIGEANEDDWRNTYVGLPGYFDTFAYLAQGIIHEQMGGAGYALDIYNRTWEILPDEPVVYYLRAQLLGAMGRTDEASFDVEWLRQFAANDPELTTLIAPLVQVYPLRTERFEEWLVYPVMGFAFGPGGKYAVDETDTSPIPVKLAAYPEVNGIFAIGLNQASALYDIDFPADALVLKQNGSDYEYARPILFDDGGKIQLEQVNSDEQVFTGKSSLLFFEDYGYQSILLAPAGVPDPRVDLLGERCGVISRFRPGMTFDVYSYDMETLQFFDAPNGNPRVSLESEQPKQSITVLKSQCVDGTMWWYAQAADNVTGWVRENDGTQYMIHPASDAARYPVYCPAVPQPRLFIGGQGTVLPGSGVNNVRAETRTTASVVTQIPENAEFSIIGGPVCADGYLWWQVDYQGKQGWTAEGTLEQYWLAPVLPEIP